MTLYDLIRQETAGSRRDIVLVAGVSGLANAALLALINSAVRGTSSQTHSLRQLALFVIAFALYAITFRRTFYKITTVLEGILNGLRVRIADKIRQTDLFSLERIDQAQIYNLLTSEARVLSESAGTLAAALQSAILVTFAGFYLAMLSLPAFFFCVVLIGATIPMYLRRLRGANVWMRETSQQEVHSFNTIRDLLDGFKEVQFNEDRSRDLMIDIRQSAETLRALKIKAADLYNVNYIYAHGAFYGTIAAVIFLLPRMVALGQEDMVQVMMTVLFIIGPLGVIISGLQALSKSNVAVQNMARLEEQLDRFTRSSPAGGPVAVAVPRDFGEIRMRALSFHYVDPEGNEAFRVGPLDLALRRREILFVMGGNGSGKTTFLKLLTGLYPPDAGRLLVDDTEIGEAALRSYRSFFAAIFSDFYLFRKLYGLSNVQPERVQTLLRQFHLDHKTAFAGDRFTNIELSTGQRNRLPMIVALLEDRPIYVFDEWAADQDPEFRRYFYEELLPDLAARGKTIVAVTHDERYLHVAHRVMKMELGRVESIIDVVDRGGPGSA